MPFLLQFIAQRVLLFSLSFLTFLGISPNIEINSAERVVVTPENSQEIVQDILSDYNDQGFDDINNFLNEVITEAQKDTIENQEIIQNPEKPETDKTEDASPINLPSRAPNPADLKIPPKAEAEPEVKEETETVEVKPEETLKENDSFEIGDVLVNIICTERNGNYISANTGSGVIISSEGAVITNAHVAQFFLLDKIKENMECALYRENIPTFGYRAELVYISPSWIIDNAKLINDDNPRGTGEDDYAILHITGNTNPALAKPSSFNYASVNTSFVPEVGDGIYAAGYPGAPNNILNITKSVGLKIDATEVEEVYTFGNNQIDVISTGITPVAARGASGGGIFEGNELVGVIVTTSGSTGSAYINGITTNYINRDLAKDFGQSLKTIINSNLGTLADSFWESYGAELAEVLLENY